MKEKIKAAWHSVERARRFKLDHVVRAMYDVTDNLPWYGEPRKLSIDSEQTDFEAYKSHMSDCFVPPEFVRTSLNTFQEGGVWHHHEVPGRVEDNTKHGHRFIVENDDETLRLFFLDPEHMVGKRNLLRPAICNVLAVAIAKEQQEVQSFAFQRVRTQNVDEQNLNFVALGEFAHRMLEESEISLTPTAADKIFALHLSSDDVNIQSRYVGPNGLAAPLKGTLLPRFIQGKVDTTQIILDRFVKIQNDDGFQLRTQNARGEAMVT